MLFKKLLAAVRPRERDPNEPSVEHPLEIEEKLNGVHSRAPIRKHLDVLYGDLTIGEERYVDLYFRCLERTGTLVTPFNIFQRFQTRHDLVRYFIATLQVPGARVECGAYRGATALLLCEVWRSRNSTFRGEGFYLIDSFTGTSESSPEDFIPVREPGRDTELKPFFAAGKSDVTPEMVRSHLAEFPNAQICAGWVPRVFDGIGEECCAFVHVDLTLYEATLAALEYFYPKLSAGGVMFCDGSIFCPGVEKAVDVFSSRHGVPYVVLGHRHYVFLRPAL